MGEVRVSDHPVMNGTLTSNISFNRPASYLELAKAFVAKHNSVASGNLAVIDFEPYILGAESAGVLLAEKEARENLAATYQAERVRIESDRRAWWDEQVAASGLAGDYKEIKAVLKRQGLRYPAVEKD